MAFFFPKENLPSCNYWPPSVTILMKEKNSQIIVEYVVVNTSVLCTERETKQVALVDKEQTFLHYQYNKLAFQIFLKIKFNQRQKERIASKSKCSSLLQYVKWFVYPDFKCLLKKQHSSSTALPSARLWKQMLWGVGPPWCHQKLWQDKSKWLRQQTWFSPSQLAFD